MKKKFIALIGAVSLLAACETASQKVVGGSATSSANGSSASSSKVSSSKVSSSKVSSSKES
ncbi:MAG: hypothetical protein O2916_07580, partial [Proteobacteria bacterium]|nr:hypothetical protein [Pseudomonadota bacterium]